MCVGARKCECGRVEVLKGGRKKNNSGLLAQSSPQGSLDDIWSCSGQRAEHSQDRVSHPTGIPVRNTSKVEVEKHSALSS